MPNMDNNQMQEWGERAQRVRAKLASLGLPVQVEMAWQGELVAKFTVEMGPLTTIALLEMLAANIEGFMMEDPEQRRRRLSMLGSKTPSGEA